MSNGELLNVEPLELKFPFELKKLISCTLQLTNKTDNNVAFKVKTTNPKKYCVRPNNGIVMPRSTSNVVVTMQAQKEAPADLQSCRDKFLLQSVVTTTHSTVTAEMFDKEKGHVEEHKLKVVYTAPTQPPSPVTEGSEEGFSPSNNAVENTFDGTRGFANSRDKLPEVKSHHVSKLTEEKASATHQELELLKRDSNKSVGVSITSVIIIGFVGIVLGYLYKRT